MLGVTKKSARLEVAYICNLMIVSFNQGLNVGAALKKVAMWPILTYKKYTTKKLRKTIIEIDGFCRL